MEKRLIVFAVLVLTATASVNAQQSSPAGATNAHQSSTAALVTSNAQRRATVSGVVADAETRRGIAGAVVSLAPEADSTTVVNVVSGAGGAFLTGLGRVPHIVRTSILGYEPARRRVAVASARTVLDTIFLREGVAIATVRKEAVALRTTVEGDTLIYNADSYKVAADANVSGLLEKMPGIKVDGGKVEAQGETVKKVLIDGREYFGEDVGTAIQSLPAEVVKSIEVFDKLSDNAEFTGIDDGEGYKAINIRTRESMRQGVMGQLSGLYGAEPADKGDPQWHHYGLASGNVNIFNGDAKITAGGTLNNLGQRSFTLDDSATPSGIAKIGRLQLNYIDTWGKRDQWKIDASYIYGGSDDRNHTLVEREYYDNDLYRKYNSDTHSKAIDGSHTFHARIDFKPNTFHELRIRPIVNIRTGTSNRTGFEEYFPTEGATETRLDNWSNSRTRDYRTGLNVNYRVRLGKPGRTLSVFFMGYINPSTYTGEVQSERLNSNEIRQRTPRSDHGYGARGGATYTEPLGKSSLASLDYSVAYLTTERDRKVYYWDSDPTIEDYYSTPAKQLSGLYNSGYLTHRVGPGYRMQTNGTTLSLGAYWEHATLQSTRLSPTNEKFGPWRFNNFTYSAMLTSKFGRGASARVFLNSGTRSPSIENLQEVVDISNLGNIRTGNSQLRPAYSHRLYARVILPNTDRGRTFSFNVGGSLTRNAIVQSTITGRAGFPVVGSDGLAVVGPEGESIILDGAGRFSRPVNMNGEWSVRFGVDYGFPVTFLRSNLNIDANISYNSMPSQIGKWLGGSVDNVAWTTNRSGNLATGGGVTLGSNISEKIDFRIGYEASYNRVRNTSSTRSNSEYLRQRARLDFKFVLPLDFTISGGASFNSYTSISGLAVSQIYFLANAGIGKKIFRSRQGEVTLFVNDIFNQNVGFRRRAYAQWVENETYSVVGRYFGVKFTWNIRWFGKNGSRNLEMYKTTPGEGGPFGHPGGMGGHPGGMMGGGRGR